MVLMRYKYNLQGLTGEYIIALTEGDDATTTMVVGNPNVVNPKRLFLG